MGSMMVTTDLYREELRDKRIDISEGVRMGSTRAITDRCLWARDKRIDISGGVRMGSTMVIRGRRRGVLRDYGLYIGVLYS